MSQHGTHHLLVIFKQQKMQRRPSREVQQDEEEVAIFDEDYWEDQQAPSTEEQSKECADQPIDNSILCQIENQISCSRQNFFRPPQLKKPQQLLPLDYTNPQIVIKQGYLQKKTAGFFFNWHKRYLVLTGEKLVSFEDDSKRHATGCVNLRILHAQLLKTAEGLLLDFGGECESLLLRASSMSEQTEWRAAIAQVLQFHNRESKVFLRTANKFTYEQRDVMTERDFIRSAETGDIILFRTENFGAKLQRFFTVSDFDHVGMIVKLQKKDLMVFEANQMHGVAIYDWKQYISYFNLYEQVTVRKLNYIRKPEAQNTLLKFVKKQLGKKYQLSAAKLLQFESDFNWETVNEERGYFCSELIAKALKSVGLLDEKKSSGRYWPVDFSEKNGMQLKRGATLGPQQTVILNKHTKNPVL